MHTTSFICPEQIRLAVIETHGVFAGELGHVDPVKVADDALDPEKAKLQAQILQRYSSLQNKHVLEIGAGFGMNMIVWHKEFGAASVGIEPEGFGFDSSLSLARSLAQANGVDPECIIDAAGENLPFPDASFDIVFSANVLEHTDDPARVLHESLRVLRPGGVLQFVFPNYHSYYDGHYGVFHPPVLWRGFFPWYVKFIWRRDPAFARTLRTELNVGWVKRRIADLRKDYSFEVLGLGDELFLERMTSLDFAAWASLGRVKRVLDWIGKPSIRRALGKTIIALRGWTPIVLTLRKKT